MEQDAQIIKLWSEGVAASEIGRMLGRSKGSIVGRIYRLREAGVDIPRRRVEKKEKPIKVKEKTIKIPAIFLAPIKDALDNNELTGDGLKTLFDLRLNDCRYIIGRSADRHIYCAEPAHKRQMCKAHYDLCYVMVEKPTKSKTFVFKNF